MFNPTKTIINKITKNALKKIKEIFPELIKQNNIYLQEILFEKIGNHEIKDYEICFIPDKEGNIFIKIITEIEIIKEQETKIFTLCILPNTNIEKIQMLEDEELHNKKYELFFMLKNKNKNFNLDINDIID